MSDIEHEILVSCEGAKAPTNSGAGEAVDPDYVKVSRVSLDKLPIHVQRALELQPEPEIKLIAVGPGENFYTGYGTLRVNLSVTITDKLVTRWLRSTRYLDWQTDNALRVILKHYSRSLIHHRWIAQVERLMVNHEKMGGRDKDFPHLWMDVNELHRFGEEAMAALTSLNTSSDVEVPDEFVFFKDMLDLTGMELRYLYFHLLRVQIVYFPTLVDSIVKNEKNDASNIEELIEISPRELKAIQKGFLFEAGILANLNQHSVFGTLDGRFSEILCIEKPSVEKIAAMLFPQEMKTELTLDLYPHIATETKRVSSIIKSAMEERLAGINILLWGQAGSGKTEYVIALCKANGWTLRAVGDYSKRTNEEKSRAERLLSLKLAIKLYGRDNETVILFDELEDLLKTDNNASFSKAFLNRLIETSTSPIIWTSNRVDTIDEAMRRRMVYNIKMGVPPSSTRELIWKHYVAKSGLVLTAKAVEEFATTYDIVPSAIANAVHIARVSRVEEAEVPDIITSIDTLMRGGEKRRFAMSVRKDTPYDIDWVNSELDLHKLTPNLVQCDPNLSILLYGPAGTGKSEYLRYIAMLRRQKVLFKRASDLESCWVGKTEKNIAEAFDEARIEGWFLIIDEGDTFLEDRRHARQSWEKSKVNEILSQMETNEQPFGMTTNLFENIDPAAMRRFTFKLKFDYLLPGKAKSIFEAYFKVPAPLRILNNSLITPGDIAAAHKKAKIMHINDADALLDLVEAETDLKRVSKPIGFQTV